MMEYDRPSRFRFRIKTVLFVVVILALILVVVIQQVQIGRMRQQAEQMRRLIDAGMKEKVTLSKIVRELRDHLERQR